MPSGFTAKTKRNFIRVLPFGLIWLLTGWVFLLTETLITGNQNLSPGSAVTLNLPVFIFASLSVAVVGLLIGVVELVVLEKKFKRYSFATKVVAKFAIYLLLMLLVMAIAFPLATGIELSVSIFDDAVFVKTITFFKSLTFVNTLIQLAFQLLLSLFYAAISENLGHLVLYNLVTGKYHRPRVEE